MVRLGVRGIADVLAMVFMFVLLVLGAVLMHAYTLRPLQAAVDRQLELKCEHLYKAVETAWVEPYTVSFLKAAADNLVLENPVVPGDHLRSQMFAAIDYLRPHDFVVSISLRHGQRTWELVCPENSSETSRQFIRLGRISITKAGGENVVVEATVKLFQIS
ncbi:MAG: hypothetical protein QMC89_03170 [Candidatus Hodarchaeaceae archaeon]|nr:hypothetical protein [Candidatus Hodarchaeaceae archaeon]